MSVRIRNGLNVVKFFFSRDLFADVMSVRSRNGLNIVKFFLEGFVCWRHERAQEEYEARSRNWIWLDKFTRYVIKLLAFKVREMNMGISLFMRPIFEL